LSQENPATKRNQLEQAIVHLEGQRAVLGDAVVEAALAPLRQELAQLEQRPSNKMASAERRIVTTLFSDVTGSTSLAERMDPEEWTVIMNRIFERLIEPVERYDGTVARLMGDGILAFFGAPVAHEDDPERAVLASLEILRGAHAYREQLQKERGLSFDVRVGINTGLAVVGEVGSDTTGEYTAMGDAVNLAARMEQSALPGTVQIAEATHKLVAHLFETEPLGSIQAKGKRELVQAYRVVGRRKAVYGGRSVAVVNSPLVGRDQELQALQGIVAEVRRGQGHIVAVVGEAGLGKSRLIAELRAEWHATQPPADGPAIWREMASTSYSGNRPYSSFQTQLQLAAGITSDDSADSARSKLRQMLQEDPGHEHLQTVYEVLLGLKSEEDARLEGDAFRRALFTTTLESVRAEIGDKSAALIFEDMHWTDSASLALEGHLLQLVQSQSALMLFSFRPDRQAPIWNLRDSIIRDYGSRFTEIRLKPLSADDSDSLVNHLFVDESLPSVVRQLVLDRSDGNPLYIEEIIHALTDQGLLQQQAGELIWQPDARLEDVDIPANLQALLAARIDRLATDIRRTLQLASVIGRSFYYRVLEQISEAVPELARHLDTLQEVDLVREASRLPEWEFIFRHALTQEAAYRTLLRQERRAFHLRVGQALEALFADRSEEMAPILAMHFAEARQPEKAMRYYRLAGDAAFRLSANVEAVTHYTLALSSAMELDADGATLTYFYLRRGRAQDLQSEHGTAITNYEEMIRQARERSDKRMELAGINALATIHATVNPRFDQERAVTLSELALELSKLLDDAAAEARARWNLMLAHWYGLGDPEVAVANGEASLTIARKENLREQQALTLTDLGLAYGGIGAWHRGIEVFEESREMWRELSDQPMLANNLSNSAIPYFLTGEFEAALSAGREARDISRAVENGWGQISSILLVNYVHWKLGEPGPAIANMAEAHAEVGKASGVKQPLAFGDGVVAWIFAALGAPDLGEVQFQRARDLADSMPGVMKPWHYAVLALREIETGNLTGAERFLNHSLKDLQLKIAGSPAHITAFLARGRLSLAKGQFQLAVDEFEEMLSEFQRADVRYFVADAQYYRALALLSLGQGDMARLSLFEARASAEALNARRILWKILVALGDLEPDRNQAGRARRQARQIVRHIADHTGSDSLQAAFMGQPVVRKLFNDEQDG
jgi:class 3 adenylate cyclase/tetratricopeptide (TPR) repeat protein